MKELMLDIFGEALAAVDPYRAVKQAVRIADRRIMAGGEAYDLDRYDRVIVIGAGKAAARMAAAIEETLDDRVDAGLIIVKYGHTASLRIIEQREASHPLPDTAGMRGTERIREMVIAADARTLIVCLLSGGASSLLVLPEPGIPLAAKQKTTDLLLKAGASIREVNAVRKHISLVKGGRLAQAAYPATVLTLILSDVIGNALDVIASGPTAPDPTTFADAASVIEKYGLKPALPSEVLARIERGMKGREPETAKSRDSCFAGTRNIIVGSLAPALAAARGRAADCGCSAEIVSAELQGEARKAALRLAEAARLRRENMKAGERGCLLFGGETTVTVRGNGAGGRNQELALAFAIAVEGVPGITLLSAGTDGTDGPTDAAGAFVDGETVKRAREAGLEPLDYLERNDSYSFFKRFDSKTGRKSHIVTGPTGTNVMDMQIICIEKRE